MSTKRFGLSKDTLGHTKLLITLLQVILLFSYLFDAASSTLVTIKKREKKTPPVPGCHKCHTWQLSIITLIRHLWVFCIKLNLWMPSDISYHNRSHVSINLQNQLLVICHLHNALLSKNENSLKISHKELTEYCAFSSLWLFGQKWTHKLQEKMSNSNCFQQ